jgi:hypothetical protein
LISTLIFLSFASQNYLIALNFHNFVDYDGQ